jgi:hypothetical protein
MYYSVVKYGLPKAILSDRSGHFKYGITRTSQLDKVNKLFIIVRSMSKG